MPKICRCILYLAWVNICLICACGSCTKNTDAHFNVIVFSDVHFNPYYDPALFPALVSADAGEWANIFQT